MNTNNGALYFGAGIDRTQWRRDIDAMRRDILGLSQTTVQETRNMKSAFDNLSLGIAGVFSLGAVKSFVMELINVRGEFQKTEIAFSTMLGDAGKAQDLMAQMVDLAAKTPFSLQDVSSGAKQLLAFQIPANQVVDTLTRMGNIAAGLGVPLSRINLVYGQVKAKGKLMGDDLRQFTEAGIPMVAELAKKFNKTTAEVQAMVSAGKVGFKDVKDVLFSMTNEGGMFFNLMEKQSKSLSGQVANLGDAWDQMLNKIGESQDGLLSDGIQGITYLVEHYSEVGKVLLTLIEIYGAYRAALIVTSLLQGNIASTTIVQGFANLIKMIRGATVAQEALNAASLKNPYVLLATLIAALIAITYNYRNEIGELIGIIEKQTTAQKAQEAVMTSYNDRFGKGVSQTKANITELINIIRNENSSLDQRKQAYERLIAIDPTFRGVLDAQYRSTRKLGEAMEYVIGKIDAFAMAQAKAAAARKYLEESFEEQFKAGALKTQVQDADAEAKKWRKLSDDAEKAGKANLDYLRKAYDAENKRDELAKKWREQQNIANEKGSISNTIIRNNNAEIAQDEKRVAFLKERIKLNKDNGEQISLYRKELEKLEYKLSGFKPEVIKEDEEKAPTLGWAAKIKAQIQELESQLDSAPTQSAYNRIKDKIKKLNALLNPKDKTDNKQLSEILPFGSPKQIQQQIQLLKDAMDLVENGMVKIRRLDKYGRDKDKKGNPYLTGEIISIEEAGKRREALEEKLNKIQYKNFQEKIDESERQWNNYYRMAEFYGKETAEAQYKDLFQGSQTYLDYLDKQEQALTELAEKGILSQQQRADLVFIGEKKRSLTGDETPFENWKSDIDNALKSLPSFVDQIEKLNEAEEQMRLKEGKNTSLSLQANKYLKEQKRNILQQQKEIAIQFVKEQETAEQKTVEIKEKYENIREQIGKNSSYSDQERLRLLGISYKNEAKEISESSLEVFQKSDLFIKAFGDLERMGPRTLKKLKKALEEYLQSAEGQNLAAEQIKIIQDQIKKFDETIRTNPFEAITVSIKKYAEEKNKLAEAERKHGRSSAEYNDQIEATRVSLGGIFESSKDAIQGVIGFTSELGGALGLLSEESQEALKNAQQLFDGIVNAVTGYLSGDYAKMAGGIVQMITSITKAMNGDIDRENTIRQWGREIEKLKSLYEQLNKEIEKTAGESQLKMQRDLIANLKQQQEILVKMRKAENEKKNSDTDKIASYTQQIEDINNKITEIADNFKESITTSDFKDLSQKMAEALTNAFAQGEDAAKSFDKVVDDVMRNAVQNALKIQFLDKAAENIVDELYKAMGFGKGDTNTLTSQLNEAEKEIIEVSNKLKMTSATDIDNYLKLYKKREELENLISSLKQQIAESNTAGNFDGLTSEERDKIKEMGEDAMKKYMDALKQYQDLFGQSAENAQGLEGDIKGITEKTAGALEGQINAIRIMQAESLKRQKDSMDVLKNQLFVQVQIEQNTRPLKGIYDEIKELNSKVNNGLAGI